VGDPRLGGRRCLILVDKYADIAAGGKAMRPVSTTARTAPIRITSAQALTHCDERGT